MQQAVDAAEIHERTVVGEVLDLAFNDDVFFDLLKRLIFRPVFSCSITDLRDNTTFERLRLSLITLASIIWLRRLSRLRTGRTSTCEPGRNAAMPSMSTQAALDPIDDTSFDAGAVAISLFEIVPGLHAHRVGA